MPRPLLSIIIPVYNVAAFLDKCLASVCAQRVPGQAEIILVDDCSTDGCLALCQAWAGRDGRITLLRHAENRGLSAARNTGLRTARGQFVTFVDSDDTLSPGSLASALSAFDADSRIDAVEYPVAVYEGHPSGQALRLPPSSPVTFSQWLADGGLFHAYTWNKVYRRQLWQTEFFPEGLYFEDIFAVPQVLAQARLIAYSQGGLYHYRYCEASISTRPTVAKLTDRLRGMLLSYNLLTDRLGASHPAAEQYYMEMCNAQISLLRLGGKAFLPHRRLSCSYVLGNRLAPVVFLKSLANNLLGKFYPKLWASICRR